MSEMVERVARALFAVQHSRSEHAKSFKLVRKYYETRARAAIAAMREPTEAMVTAGWNEADRSDWCSENEQRETVADTFRAMIDKALEEA